MSKMIKAYLQGIANQNFQEMLEKKKEEKKKEELDLIDLEIEKAKREKENKK